MNIYQINEKVSFNYLNVTDYIISYDKSINIFNFGKLDKSHKICTLQCILWGIYLTRNWLSIAKHVVRDISNWVITISYCHRRADHFPPPLPLFPTTNDSIFSTRLEGIPRISLRHAILNTSCHAEKLLNLASEPGRKLGELRKRSQRDKECAKGKCWSVVIFFSNFCVSARERLFWRHLVFDDVKLT